MRARKPKAGYAFVQPLRRKGGSKFRGWAVIGGQRVYGPVTSDAKRAHEDALELRKDGMESRLLGDDATLGDGLNLIREYHETKDVSPATRRWFEDQAKVLLREWPATTPIKAIDHRAITRFVVKRMKETRVIKDDNGNVVERRRKVSNSSIAHYRRALSMIFSRAIHEGFVDVNPTKRVDWPKVDAPRMNFFTHAELMTVLQRIREQVPEDADTIELLYLTGFRRSEAARLRVGDIDFKAKVVWIRGKARREEVPFEDATKAVLERMVLRAVDGALFPGADEISYLFRRWSERLGEPRLTPHAMRHSFASNLAKHVNPHTLQALTRHRTAQMVKRYVHITSDDLRAALRKQSDPPAPEAPGAAAS